MTRAQENARGSAYAVGCQLIWGVQPLFWPLLDSLATSQIVAQRIVWSCLVALAFVAVSRGSRADFRGLLRGPATLRSLAFNGALLGASWGIYVYAIVSHRVVEASLALLIGPPLGALLGVVLLGERLRRAEAFACGLAVVAVGVLTVAYRGIPWIAVSIAAMVAAYNLERRRRPLPAAAATAVELGLVAPVGLVMIALGGTGAASALWHPQMLVLLPAAGLITALPTVLRTSALSRIPLATYSVLSFLNPACQFAIGVGVRHEPMTPAHWSGFALVWTALLIFAADSVRSSKAAGRPTHSSTAPQLTPPSP